MANKRAAEAIWIESKGYWQVKVQRDGVRKAFTSSIKGRKGKHAAEAKADEWLEKQLSDMKFIHAWDLFLEDQKRRNGKSNYASHESYGRLYIIPTIGNKKLSAITPYLWQSCIDAGVKNGLSRRSCINIRSSISAFIAFGRLSRWELQNVEKGDLTISNIAPHPKKKNILQPDQVKILFAESSILNYGKPVPAWYIHAWRFYTATGLRRGELCGLTWNNIQDGTITIEKSINRFKETTTGKNDNARRDIVLPALAQKILNDQKDMLKKAGLISLWVFPDKFGEQSDPQRIYVNWKRYAQQHGINSTIHELRHTFASLNKVDMPVELMKSIMGHSSSMNTYGVYGHDVNGEKARAAAIIDNVFDKIITD